MARKSLSEVLDAFWRNDWEPAYVHRRGWRTERWSYRRVAETASRFARELEARGIGKGDRVLLWGENCAEWVSAFFGCVLRGVIVVPLDKISAPDFVQRVAQQVDAKLLVKSRELHLGGDVGPPLQELTLEDLSELLAKHANTVYVAVATEPNDTAQIIFTSGTTTEPKGVVISHRNILSNLDPIEEEIEKYRRRPYFKIFHPLRFLNLLPLSHVFGQFLAIFIPQALGSTVLFQDSLNPGEVIRTIKKERVSVLIAVPRMLESLRDKIERDMETAGKKEWFQKTFAACEGEHFTKRWWRFRKIHNQFGWKFWAFISGGATLDRETETFWGRLSFVVIQGYGLTETTSLISVNHPFRLGKGSIGKVLPGRELKLAEDGEILVRGENIAAGYWKGKTLEPVAGAEGWFRTGDMGELDANGNLFFKGRKKNVIVTPAGMKVYPEDLEAALRAQPEVKDCAVIGLEREGNAEACAALIVRDGTDAADVVRRANATLADFQQMRQWLVWPEEDFPRTSTQKPRTNIIAEYAARHLAGADGRIPPSAAAGTETASSALAELLTRITGRAPANLAAGANLATDLNLSSIDRVELMSALEDRFQMDLNETKFTAATTVADIEKMLREPAAKRTEMYYPRWTQSWWQNAIRNIVYTLFIRWAVGVFALTRIRGKENLRNLRGPVIYISNHITQFDMGWVLWTLPLRLRWKLAVAMEGEYLERLRKPAPELRWFTRLFHRFQWFAVVAWFNAFPMASRSGVRESFSYAGESVDRGYSLLIYPEGQRTKHGGMNAFRAGIGLLTEKLGLPIVPMRMDGIYEYKVKKAKRIPPRKVRFTIGKPIHFAPGTDPTEITRILESVVASLEWKEGEVNRR